MNTDIDMAAVANRARSAHAARQSHFAGLASANNALHAGAASFDTTSATAACTYVGVYLYVAADLTFADGTSLHFQGNGLVLGLGGTGSLAGSASFNVPPASLRGASGISFEAAAIGIVAGGFQITWYRNNGYIGHGEFAGMGVQLGTPGGGWGNFS
jgi:hypothetical protein